MVKFIASNTTWFKKRQRQLSAKETIKIINKNMKEIFLK